jgi:hypothetical protein
MVRESFCLAILRTLSRAQNMQCTCKRVPHSSGLHLMGQHVVASLASAWPCVGEFFLLFIARSFGF